MDRAIPIGVALNPEKECEIVAGQPEEKVTGGSRHSGVGARLIARLGNYAEAHQLGGAFGVELAEHITNLHLLADHYVSHDDLASNRSRDRMHRSVHFQACALAGAIHRDLSQDEPEDPRARERSHEQQSCLGFCHLYPVS